MLIIKRLTTAIISLTLFFSFQITAIKAKILSDPLTTELGTQGSKLSEKAGFDSSVDVATIIQYVIQGFLSLLAIIFIILMLLSGYNWMTASGDEQKVQKAKDTILRAVIGMIITVGAYAITYFVFYYIGSGSGWGVASP